MTKDKNSCKSSKALYQHINVKHLTVTCFSKIIQNAINTVSVEDEDGQPESKLTLLTNIGIIHADGIEFEFTDVNDDETDFMMKLADLTSKSRNNIISGWEDKIGLDNVKITNDTEMVLLRNAVMTSIAIPNSRYALGDIILFTDQIIGVCAPNRGINTNA